MTARVELPGLGFQEVTYEVIDGRAVFEGDIVLDVHSGETRSGQSIGRRRKDWLWPERTVPYVIDPFLPDTGRVTEAINHWETRTSLRFKRRTTEDIYVRFVRGNPGTNCSSYIGMQGSPQDISLEDGCDFGSVVHEIGHAVGLFHEQSRSDRDSYVIINTSNILSNELHNFDKLTNGTLDIGPYDYGSIMHYGPYAFSANGYPTIVRADGGGTTGLGQREGLSAGDIQGVEFLYGRPTIFSSYLDFDRCLDLTDGNAVSGTPVQLWVCNGTSAQKWYRTPDRALRSALASNLCLAVANESPLPGARVEVRECNGGLAQRWSFAGAMVKSDLGPNLCLDVLYGNPTPGTVIQTMSCNYTEAQYWLQPHE